MMHAHEQQRSGSATSGVVERRTWPVWTRYQVCCPVCDIGAYAGSRDSDALLAGPMHASGLLTVTPSEGWHSWLSGNFTAAAAAGPHDSVGPTMWAGWSSWAASGLHDHATFGSGPTQTVRRTGLGANLCAVVWAEARAGIQSYVS